MAIDRCTIHHEGAGGDKPNPGGAAAGGYSIWVDDGGFVLLRRPSASWATKGFNHRSLDICIAGNRMVVPFTNHTIQSIANAVVAARQAWGAAEVPQHFNVILPHRSSPGSSTVCPGNNVVNRWSDVVNAVQGSTNPVEDDLTPEQATKLNEIHRALYANDLGFGLENAVVASNRAAKAVASPVGLDSKPSLLDAVSKLKVAGVDTAALVKGVVDGITAWFKRA